jgi:hypothetical protein
MSKSTESGENVFDLIEQSATVGEEWHKLVLKFEEFQARIQSIKAALDPAEYDEAVHNLQEALILVHECSPVPRCFKVTTSVATPEFGETTHPSAKKGKTTSSSVDELLALAHADLVSKQNSFFYSDHFFSRQIIRFPLTFSN